MGAIVVAQELMNGWCARDGRAVALVFRIENAQWIRVETTLRVFRELPLARREMGDERFFVASARIGATDGVHENAESVDLDVAQKRDEHIDHLRVASRPGIAEDLGARLRELAIPPALWPFRAKHPSEV